MPADPQRAALERALGAQFAFLHLLGRGGMGAVYLARERALERLVAIKVLPHDLVADAESRERFRREARTAARLTHPNIVPLYTFGDAEGLLYFVMGYVRGESLGARMRRSGKIPPDETRRILAELADALDYAHRQGVIHRDIKPDNVLLDDEGGRPMLTDFGVARARASGATLTDAGAVVGTPHYMSPEQASGDRDLDGRSDLYSLGVMGYAMLSGRLPFEGDSFREIIVQQVSKAPAPLATVAPDAPLALATAVSRCLAKEPAARWPDGRSMHAALSELEEDSSEALPWELRSIDGSGFWNFVFAGGMLVTLGVLAAALRRTAVADTLIGLIGIFSIASVIAVGGTWYLALRKGHSRTLVHRMLFGPPRWWPFWWPARWRRDTDVWDRLPRLVRRMRTARMIALTGVWTLGLTIVGIIGAGRPLLSGAMLVVAQAVLIGQLIAVPSLVLGVAFTAERWGKRRGLTAREAHAAVTSPTADRAFWRRAKFLALLGRETGREAGEPQAPQDYLRAINDAASRLTGPVRETGSSAAGAARQLVEAIAALDGEIAQLVRDANPAERAQVEQKLTALGDATTDHDARRKMRALLEGQRALLVSLADQLGVAMHRREQLHGLLKTLWLQVANLRAEAARDALTAPDDTGQIRALCQEIARQAESVAIVRAIAPERTP